MHYIIVPQIPVELYFLACFFIVQTETLLDQIEQLSKLIVRQIDEVDFIQAVLNWLQDVLSCKSVALIWAGQSDAFLNWQVGIGAKVALSKRKAGLIAGNRLLFAVPIMIDEDVIGVIGISRLLPAVNTSEELSLLRIAANYLATVHTKANAGNIAHSWQGELTTIYEALSALSSTELSLNNVSKVALARCIHALAVDAAILILWEPQVEQLLPRLYVDSSGNVQMMPTDSSNTYPESLLNQVLVQKTPQQILTTPMPTDPEAVQLLEATGGKSLLLVPLYGRRALDGVIILIANQSERHYSDEEIHFSATFGKHVAIAIEQGSLFDQAKRSVEEMAVLQAVALDLSSQITLPRLLIQLAERASILVNAAYTMIFLLSSDQELELTAAYSSQEDVPLNEIPMGKPVAEYVVAQKQSTMIENYWDWAKQVIPDTGGWRSFRAVAAVPLRAEGVLVGALVAFDNVPGRLFRQRELHLLDTLAPQAAISIHNMQLFSELEHQMRELNRTQAQLLQSEKLASIGRMSAAIAHEVNNPMQSIRNCLHIGMKEGLSEDKRHFYLDMALKELKRLTNTVQRFLDFYRPSKGQRTSISVVQLIDRVLALLERQLSEQDIEVIREFAQQNLFGLCQIISIRFCLT